MKSGLSIALLGPDGSGKSTIASLLRSPGLSSQFSGVRYYHANYGILPPLKTLKACFCRTNAPSSKDGQTEAEFPGMVNPHSLARSLCYLLYYAVDHFFGGLTMARAVRAGELVILDRCFYDYFFQRQNRNLPHWLLWAIAFVVPKPRLFIVLEADPSVIHSRKPDLDIEEIREQYEILSRVSSRLPNVVWLRTDCALTDAEHELSVQLQDFLSKRTLRAPKETFHVADEE